MGSWQDRGMRQRRLLFIGVMTTLAFSALPVLAQQPGNGRLFDPDIPNFQHSRFSSASASMNLARDRFQSHRTTFQPSDLRLNRSHNSANDVQLGVQTDMSRSQFVNGADTANLTNAAEIGAFDQDRRSRFSNMRLQFQDPDLQFLDFNP